MASHGPEGPEAPAYTVAPSYSDDINMESGTVNSVTMSPLHNTNRRATEPGYNPASVTGDFCDPGDGGRSSRMGHALTEMPSPPVVDNAAYNPTFEESPRKDSRFYSVVQQLLDDLPSTRREVHNMVGYANKHRTRVMADNVLQLMSEPQGTHGADGAGGPRTGERLVTGTSELRFRNTNRDLSFQGVDVDPLDDDLAFGHVPLPSNGAASSAATHTPLPWVNEDIQLIDGARNAIREQDSKIAVKRARARKLNLELEDRKKKIGRVQLWWALLSQAIRTWVARTSHYLERSSLWASQIKSLQGKHGHHVGIYFKFLRWCLAINLMMLFFMVFFVVIPYALVHGFDNADFVMYGAQSPNITTFDTFVGLFDGGGALNASAYFIGVYYLPDAVPYGMANTTGSIWDPNGRGRDGGLGDAYNIGLAYLIVIGVVLLGSFLMIFKGVYDAIRQSVLQVGVKLDEQLAAAVFCRLDYSIYNQKSLEIHQGDIRNEIKTLLHEGEAKDAYVQRMAHGWERILLKRIGINFLMLAILVVCLYGIFIAVQRSGETGAGSFVPALVLAVINAVVPHLFEKLAFAEEWRTELTVIRYTIIRAVILRFVGLYVFMYAAYRRHSEFECWESYVGQEAYTVFVVGSILFELASGIFLDMTKHIAFHRSPRLRELLGEEPCFDTIKKVLEMTYAQALVWVGTYFCPLLPLVGIIRVSCLFYVQKWSTMTWCEPKQKRFLSNHSLPKLIWSLMLASFVLAAIPLGYVIPRSSSSGVYMPESWQDRFVDTLPNSPCGPADRVVKNCRVCLNSAVSATETVCWLPLTGEGRHPNGTAVSAGNLCKVCPRGCGPFRNERSAYSVVEREYSTWNSNVKDVVAFLGTTAFTVLLAFALLGCCLTTHAKSTALVAYARKLQIERDMERLDKRWILERYAITFEEARLLSGRGNDDESGYIHDLVRASPRTTLNEEAFEDVHLDGARIVQQEAV
eukprot:m.24858 g.24858  ORF g.24858 m.24858 type:complete len:973 (+) comp4192_c0_seq1:59-2977(+)